MHKGYLALTVATILWIVFLVFWTVTHAQERVIHTSLVFLIDGSGSVDDFEWRAQVSGYAAVLSEDEVQLTLEGVEVAVVFYGQDAAVACGWGTAEETVNCLLAARREIISTDGTCPSEAMKLAFSLLSVTETERRVLDVSGDGKENCHNDYSIYSTEPMPTPAIWRDKLVEAYDAEINGLAIINTDRDLAYYYEKEIISVGGFVIELAAYEDFVKALRAKIVLEVS